MAIIKRLKQNGGNKYKKKKTKIKKRKKKQTQSLSIIADTKKKF